MLVLFKQKTAYEMRISDWSSDVCSSDLKGDQLSPPGDQIDFAHSRSNPPGQNSPAPNTQPECAKRLRPSPARFGLLTAHTSLFNIMPRATSPRRSRPSAFANSPDAFDTDRPTVASRSADNLSSHTPFAQPASRCKWFTYCL